MGLCVYFMWDPTYVLQVDIEILRTYAFENRYQLRIAKTLKPLEILIVKVLSAAPSSNEGNAIDLQASEAASLSSGSSTKAKDPWISWHVLFCF